MGVTLTIPAAIASQLARHLAAGPEEQLAFMLAEPTDGGFAVTDIRVVFGTELDDQSPWHLALRDSEGAAVIKWAHAIGSVLVEAHVHLGGFAAAFSGYDVSNLADWVPHVWWRLGHRRTSHSCSQEPPSMGWRGWPPRRSPSRSTRSSSRAVPSCRRRGSRSHRVRPAAGRRPHERHALRP